MNINILTLFPEMFKGPFNCSIIKRAVEKGLVRFNIYNIRDFSLNKHRTVDDTPFGGGAGMVMSVEPIARALEHVVREQGERGRVVLMCPAGLPFTQGYAYDLAASSSLTFICGHYEGVDERVRLLVDDEISIGDYVLTGGELPAMVVVDAVVRLIPGVLGEFTSTVEESFSQGWLEYPQYTRPRNFQGNSVPEVLLSGHHARIAHWRKRQAILRTIERRPELLTHMTLNEEEKKIVRELIAELENLLHS